MSQSKAVPLLATPEAMPGLGLRAHVERRRLLGMEGAQAPVVRADAFERDRAADQLDQVNACLDVFRDGAHLTLPFRQTVFRSSVRGKGR